MTTCQTPSYQHTDSGVLAPLSLHIRTLCCVLHLRIRSHKIPAKHQALATASWWLPRKCSVEISNICSLSMWFTEDAGQSLLDIPTWNLQMDRLRCGCVQNASQINSHIVPCKIRCFICSLLTPNCVTMTLLQDNVKKMQDARCMALLFCHWPPRSPDMTS